MHKRRFAPSFDALDARLSLSGTDVVAAGTGSAVVTSIVPATAAEASPTDNVINWYLPGMPPVEVHDPCQTLIPWDLMPTT